MAILSVCAALLGVAGCIDVDQLPQRQEHFVHDSGPDADAGPELPIPPDPPPEGCEVYSTTCEESASCDDDCTPNECGDHHSNSSTEECEAGVSHPLAGELAHDLADATSCCTCPSSTRPLLRPHDVRLVVRVCGADVPPPSSQALETIL